MNRIGIIFAMKEELEATLEKLEVINEFKIFDLDFFECKYKDKTCVLVECGIGKVNAARCSQILIDNLEIDVILNVGVAGGISSFVNICDVVVADKLVQHDFDLRPFDYERGFIPKVGKYINCDEYLVKLASEINIDNKISIGTIASGDIFVTEEMMGKKINDKFSALCVEMEGAAIAQICYLSNVPFLVIRSISDSPNGNNNITFDEFLDQSSKMAANFLIQLLNKIN
ncbi:MAG: 5'-methylthioadenosine/adenosylhomocysteine nucleosidase [Firmicutes bacterium]|nr:5'-methylthioadenosine/adenosylhomocysteine nucleosidase [Bacillota bacterium]